MEGPMLYGSSTPNKSINLSLIDHASRARRMVLFSYAYARSPQISHCPMIASLVPYLVQTATPFLEVKWNAATTKLCYILTFEMKGAIGHEQ